MFMYDIRCSPSLCGYSKPKNSIFCGHLRGRFTCFFGKTKMSLLPRAQTVEYQFCGYQISITLFLSVHLLKAWKSRSSEQEQMSE